MTDGMGMETPGATSSVAELEAEIRQLRELVAVQAAEIEKLRRLVDELQRKQHRPHAPFSKGTPKAAPKPPGRKPGTAYGRKGHRQRPRKVDEVYAAPSTAAIPCRPMRR